MNPIVLGVEKTHWRLKKGPFGTFSDAHGHELPQQAAGENTSEGEVRSNGPVSVVIMNGDGSEDGLKQQQHS